MVHLIDYSKGYLPSTAFTEWLYWITAMAPFDIQLIEEL
jgi:hypothetical protein